MASISVCMIVKNEEKVLARCLHSLAGIPDEIIIVDTGSTDKTKSIAREYTRNVYDYAWCDDFSKARNFSLSKATTEYIYVADADEVLDEENRERFIQLKKAILPEVEVVEMAYSHQFSFNTTENFELEFRPKLFRRLREFLYTDPIHEVLRTDPIVYRSNIVVSHRPTSDHSGRDLAIFAKLVAHKEKISSRLEMMYARELLIAGKREDFMVAEQYFKNICSNPTSSLEAARRAACVLSFSAAQNKDVSLLLEVAAPELVGRPPAEICCALGNYYLAIRQAVTAADWYAAALSGAEPELVAASVGSVPLQGLADCYEQLGDKNQAEQYRKQAQNWQPEMLLG